jgi:hypothetical protein
VEAKEKPISKTDRMRDYLRQQLDQAAALLRRHGYQVKKP